MNKYDIKEIEMALSFLKKHASPVSVRVEIDPYERLILSANDFSANEIKITIYNHGPESKMAEVTRTERLTND